MNTDNRHSEPYTPEQIARAAELEHRAKQKEYERLRRERDERNRLYGR